jgi:Cdc6-like AAA superfamily ATPase
MVETESRSKSAPATPANVLKPSNGQSPRKAMTPGPILSLLDQPIDSLEQVPKVQINHVLKVVSESLGSANARKIKELPIHHQLVLCVLVIMERTLKPVEITYGTLQSKYFETVNDSSMPKVTRSEFTDVVSMLEVQSMITLHKAKEERLRRVTMNVRAEEVESGTADTPTLVDLLKQRKTI